MSIILAKEKKDVIKILKKLGETVVVAKAEVLYSFKKGFFPHQTVEEVMEEIKKQPHSYDYYKVGAIKIIEMEEVK